MRSDINAPNGQTVVLPAPFVLPTPPSPVRGALAKLRLAPMTTAEKAWTLYGGSTMNWALDGSKRWFLGCNAVNSATDLFAFYVFLFQNGVLTNVPLQAIGEGRGWLDVPPDGIMRWSAWQGASFVPGAGPAVVPGAVNWTSGGGVPPTSGMPVAIPPNGAIAALYTGKYTAADFDTAEETAIRVQKILDAFHEHIALQKKAGVLI